MKQNIQFHIRISEELLLKLQLVSEHYKTDKSKLLRQWIEDSYNKLSEEE